MPATYADHRAQLKAILCGWGMPEDNAEITAEVLAWSDLHGVDSHGISMILKRVLLEAPATRK